MKVLEVKYPKSLSEGLVRACEVKVGVAETGDGGGEGREDETQGWNPAQLRGLGP